jgi:hypothetical protein
MQLPLRQGDVHHTDAIVATGKIIAQCDDEQTAAELVAMVNEATLAQQSLEKVERERDRTFPIQSQRGSAPHPTRIPWEVADLAYSVYSARHGKSQSLELLAERGGFGPIEMDDLLPGWRERCDKLSLLTADLAAKDQRIEELAKQLRKANARVEVLENTMILDAIQNGRLP